MRPRQNTPIVGWLCFLVFLGASPGLASGQSQDLVIRAIELEGLERLSEGVVLARIQIKVGDTFRREALDTVYQQLWSSGDFLTIYEPQIFFENQGVRIVITFVEKELIDRVRLRGTEEIDETELRGSMVTQAKGLLNPRDLERDQESIERIYREQGYYFVSVTHETRRPESPARLLKEADRNQDQVVTREEAEEAGRNTTEAFEDLDFDEAGRITFEQIDQFAPGSGVTVTFRVNEGPRVRVDRVSFYGNHSFEDSELLRFMATRPRSPILGIPHAGHFDPDRYQQDLVNLQSFYIYNGFFDAVVAVEDFAFNLERNRLYLGIRIEEGERYSISDIQFEIVGNGVFPESRLREETKVVPGDLYEEEKVLRDLNAILTLYKNHAYIECRADKRFVLPPEGNEVALVYRIIEGEQAYVEEIEIRGNAETRDKVIRRELTFYPGEKVNFEKINESYSNLFRLQYFDRVDIVYEQGSTPNQKNLIVDVDEGRTGSLNFGFGITSGRGAVGIFSVSKRNFDFRDLPDGFLDFTNAWTGAGQTLILQAQPGTDDSRFRVEFREPHIFDSRTSLFLRGFRTEVDRRDFTEQRVAGEIGLGHQFPFDRNLRAEIGYRYELTDIGDIDPDAAPDVFRVEGNNRLSALIAELSYDRRRFTLRGLITGGWSASLSYEYAGGFLGAEVDINKARATFNIHQSVHSVDDKRHHIINFRNTFAWSEPRSNTREVPIFERYFLGGARSLRGFRFREVGPHFGRDPIGGAVMQHGSLEYTFPIVEEVLRGIAFTDYGTLAEDMESFALDRYRVAVGGGVLINVNVFGQRLPISLTWGEAIRSEEEDRERLFLFDIGTGF